MKNFGLLISMLILVGCEQETNTTSNDINSKVSQVAASHPEPPQFNCVSYKSRLKEVDLTITAVQNVRPINKDEQDAIDYYQKYLGAAKQLFGVGNSGESNYVLKQKVPGQISGICIAEAFYIDGSNSNIIFTISQLDNEEFISIQADSNLQEAQVLYRVSKPEVKAASTESKEVGAKESTDNPSSVPSSEKLVQPVDIALNEKQILDNKVTPSFNCDKAITNVEKMICADSKLASLDIKLDSAYQDAFNSYNNIDELKANQKTWIKNRNGCQNTDCISNIYESRIKELAPWEYE